MKTFRVALLLILPAAIYHGCQPTGKADFPNLDQFSDPPAEFRAHAGIGMRLNTVDEESARDQIRHYSERGFGGVFISAGSGNSGDLPEWYVEQGGSFMHLMDSGIVYLSDEFIQVYRAYLDEAEKLGMRVILYDDYHFPTGQVAGQFYQNFPEDMADRLDKVEMDHDGAGTLRLEVPEGTFLGAALWDRNGSIIEDISKNFEDGRIELLVGEGSWKLMAFYLNHEAVNEIRNPGIMNYLEKEAVENFLSISYNKFYKGFGEYFGSVIPMSFYDEPSLHWMDGRIWSDEIGKIFKERTGESPVIYYPALWYDTGPSTEAARNALLGIRAEMYELNFVKQLADWCDEHGIMLSGHMDQEEIPNPCMANGDLMKVFKYQQVPGTDDVFWWGRMNPGYKVVSSSAYNWDKPIVWAETYAAYRECSKEIAYKAAMDQYAMGINMQNPFPRAIEKYMDLEELKEFNKYIGRLSYLLQGGRHVADVAVVYPIAAAQAYNVFGEGWEYGYMGGEVPDELDYMQVGEELFRGMQVDFTYLHPEVLTENCLIDDATMILDNKVNREEFKVVILPGGSTLEVETAQRLLDFYQAGGKIIATSRLPEYSAGFGKDEQLNMLIKEIFAEGQNSNDKGGEAVFIEQFSRAALEEVLDRMLPVRDLRFEVDYTYEGSLVNYQFGMTLDSKEWMNMQKPVYNGALTYTHKVKEGKDIYFISNSSLEELDARILLKGDQNPAVWDPHTGIIGKTERTLKKIEGVKYSSVALNLGPAKSTFLISE